MRMITCNNIDQHPFACGCKSMVAGISLKEELEMRLVMLEDQREAMINACNVKQTMKLGEWIDIVKKQLRERNAA